MESIKLEISLNDIVEDMFCDAEIDYDLGARPRKSFNEEVKLSIIDSVSSSITSKISSESLKSAENLSLEAAKIFVDSELEGIITRRLRSGEIKTKYNGFQSFDHLIEEQIKRFDFESAIKKHVDIKTKEFAQEIRSRYDNVFAAKVVQGLNDQKMLDPNIAKLLLG